VKCLKRRDPSPVSSGRAKWLEVRRLSDYRPSLTPLVVNLDLRQPLRAT
jgi:hypothetical protein